MVNLNEHEEEFEFESDPPSEFGELLEAFINEELDTEFMDELDYDYLEMLVEQPDSAIPSDVGEQVQQAVVEIADLILQRIDAQGQ